MEVVTHFSDANDDRDPESYWNDIIDDTKINNLLGMGLPFYWINIEHYFRHIFSFH